MTRVTRLPDHRGLIVGNKLYLRDEYFAADHVSKREWLAFVALLLGLAVWVGGLVWVIAQVLRRLG